MCSLTLHPFPLIKPGGDLVVKKLPSELIGNKKFMVLNVTLIFVIIITKALHFVSEYYTVSFLGLAGLQRKREAEKCHG